MSLYLLINRVLCISCTFMIGSDNGGCFVEMRMISIYIYYTDNFEDNLELSSQIGIIGSNFTLKFLY